jgi:uncharacterized protein (DUF2141 family)
MKIMTNKNYGKQPFSVSAIFVVLMIIIFVLNTAFFGTTKGKPSTIEVNISKLASNQGQVIVALYNSKTTFLKSPIIKKTAKIYNKKSGVIFRNIAKGTYAISVIHDENANGKLDFNILGIPSEDVAASNNASAFIGPPSFDDAKFNVGQTRVIQNIKM